MQKTLVVAALLTCRVATLLLCCASLARMVTAPLVMHYIAFRLLYDGAVAFCHVPLPGNIASALIIFFEWIVSVLLFAASCSTLGVEVFMDKDTGVCRKMHLQPCRWYKEAAILGLLASVFSFTIAILLFGLQSSQHAQPPAPAPALGHNQG